jgi:hypothetical protein
MDDVRKPINSVCLKTSFEILNLLYVQWRLISHYNAYAVWFVTVSMYLCIYPD